MKMYYREDKRILHFRRIPPTLNHTSVIFSFARSSSLCGLWDSLSYIAVFLLFNYATVTYCCTSGNYCEIALILSVSLTVSCNAGHEFVSAQDTNKLGQQLLPFPAIIYILCAVQFINNYFPHEKHKVVFWKCVPQRHRKHTSINVVLDYLFIFYR